jgi:hypothetical protein
LLLHSAFLQFVAIPDWPQLPQPTWFIAHLFVSWLPLLQWLLLLHPKLPPLLLHQ